MVSFAKASKDVVFGLSIPLLIFLLLSSKSGVFCRRGKPLGRGFSALRVTCLKV